MAHSAAVVHWLVHVSALGTQMPSGSWQVKFGPHCALSVQLKLQNVTPLEKINRHTPVLQSLPP